MMIAGFFMGLAAAIGAIAGWMLGRRSGIEQGRITARAYWDEVMRQRFWGER